MRRLEAQFEAFQNQQGEFATQVNNEKRQTGSRIAAIEATIRDREEAIRNRFEQMAAQRAAEMAAVVAEAKSELDNQRLQLQTISNAVQVEFTKLQQQIDQTGSSKDAGKSERSFLPLKELKPSKLGKEEQWRDWSENFAEFVEASCAGMKECLKQVAKHETRPDAEVVGVSNYSELASRSESLYSALKHLTEEGSAARRVINSTPQEDGFAAWWNLNSTFTQALAARQGTAMSQFTNTHWKPGNNPAETRTKLIEVDNAIK